MKASELMIIMLVISITMVVVLITGYQAGYQAGIAVPRKPTFAQSVFRENELWQLRYQKRHCQK